jgi:hypothetical protein
MQAIPLALRNGPDFGVKIGQERVGPKSTVLRLYSKRGRLVPLSDSLRIVAGAAR